MSLLDQWADHVEAIVARKDSHLWLILENRALHLVGFIETHIRRITDDEIEVAPPGQCPQDIALEEANSTVQLQAGGVGAGDLQCLG